MSYYYRTYDKVSIPRMVPSALLDASQVSSYTNFFQCICLCLLLTVLEKTVINKALFSVCLVSKFQHVIEEKRLLIKSYLKWL